MIKLNTIFLFIIMFLVGCFYSINIICISLFQTDPLLYAEIVITGGAGFIGSAVVRHIIENTQDSVVNVDKLTYAGSLESLESVENNPRYAFEQVDICDAKALARVFEQHLTRCSDAFGGRKSC